MNLKALVLAAGCWVAFQAPNAQADYGVFAPSPLAKGKPVLVAWDSEAGRQRFARAAYKQDFFQLAQAYQPQINPLYCAIASSVIVLNALRLPQGNIPSQTELEIQNPPSLGGNRQLFQSYSQLSFLNAATEAVKPRRVIELKNLDQDPGGIDPGLSLADIQAMLHSYHAEAELHYADAEDPAAATRRFRQTLKAVLADSTRFLLVNFNGQVLGTPTKGHVSPLAAYDSRSDAALVLDVASHRNPWYWVPVSALYQAMHTQDGQQFRGYLIVSDPAQP